MAWFPVRPGCFAIFYPEDAHAPCCGQGVCRKIVLKIKA
ncbi:MAG TPA: YhcH/YjgK/YiaL family protein [Lentisphaeria bacterium]|nr:YhcH/YjgK/YiaL family protein [Lentisphaeria bacterium]